MEVFQAIQLLFTFLVILLGVAKDKMRPKNRGRMYHWRTASLWVPIYDVSLQFVVTNNVRAYRLRPEIVERFGDYDGGQAYGLASYKGSDFLIVVSDATHCTIAQVIFHITHQIMEACSHRLRRNGHEPHAYLNGWITRRIYEILREWKVRVK